MLQPDSWRRPRRYYVKSVGMGTTRQQEQLALRLAELLDPDDLELVAWAALDGQKNARADWRGHFTDRAMARAMTNFAHSAQHALQEAEMVDRVSGADAALEQMKARQRARDARDAKLGVVQWLILVAALCGTAVGAGAMWFQTARVDKILDQQEGLQQRLDDAEAQIQVQSRALVRHREELDALKTQE